MEIPLAALATSGYVCYILTPVIPDASVLGHEWPELAGSRSSIFSGPDTEAGFRRIAYPRRGEWQQGWEGRVAQPPVSKALQAIAG